jgi:hypothetical protein
MCVFCAQAGSPQQVQVPQNPSPFGPYTPGQLPPQPPPGYVLQPVGTVAKTDTCAVLSTVFGGISWLLFCFHGGVFGLVALILGIVSLVRTRENPYLTGRSMAWTGIALSIVPIISEIVLLIQLFLFISGTAYSINNATK